jgi:hypothetical protein
MPSGDWEPFSFQLLSNRVVKFDKLSPPQYSGDIHARTAQAIELKQEKDGPMLCIETGHKNFELKGQSKKDLPKWHLRLQEVAACSRPRPLPHTLSRTPSRAHLRPPTLSRSPSRSHPLPHALSLTPCPSRPLAYALALPPSRCHPLVATLSLRPSRCHPLVAQVIMLAEKVSNIAAGWLLKEELGGGADGRDKQLKNYYFILFSNGVLMRFTDEKTAKLGQVPGLT